MLNASVALPLIHVIKSENLNSSIVGILQNNDPLAPMEVWRELKRNGRYPSRAVVLHRLNILAVLGIISREIIETEHGVLKTYKPADLG